MIVEGETISLPYQDNGLAVGQHLKDSEWSEDIVSEWQEPIDERELENLAQKAESQQFQIVKQGYSLGQCIGIDFIAGFKAGYHRVLGL